MSYLVKDGRYWKADLNGKRVFLGTPKKIAEYVRVAKELRKRERKLYDFYKQIVMSIWEQIS